VTEPRAAPLALDVAGHDLVDDLAAAFGEGDEHAAAV
jgi:hypothetical protein